MLVKVHEMYIYQKELHSSFPYRLNLTARTCDKLFTTWVVSFWSLVFLGNWKRLSRRAWFCWGFVASDIS